MFGLAEIKAIAPVTFKFQFQSQHLLTTKPHHAPFSLKIGPIMSYFYICLSACHSNATFLHENLNHNFIQYYCAHLQNEVEISFFLSTLMYIYMHVHCFYLLLIVQMRNDTGRTFCTKLLMLSLALHRFGKYIFRP